MKFSRIALLFGGLVVACTSADPVATSTPPAATQPAQPAQQAPQTAAQPVVAAAVAPVFKSLKSAMKSMDDDWKAVEKAIESDLQGTDLAALAKSAAHVSAIMKLAYDPFEDKEVPDFAKLAKEAEAGLMDFAKAAEAGDLAKLRELGKKLQSQHCARCHDAVEEVHG
ncbi:MAG: hypothetical protein RL398_776 [Planctomycetota bacterium]|jgi:hypothetical protein